MSRTGVGKGHVKIEKIAKARAARGSLPYGEATKERPVLLPEWVPRSGLVAVLPEADELFLDVDDRADLKVMREILGVLGRRFQIVETQRTTSKSGRGHWHIYLRAPRDLDPLERIALQACLGSDRTREALSLLRHIDGKYAPTVFFETITAARARLYRPRRTAKRPAFLAAHQHLAKNPISLKIPTRTLSRAGSMPHLPKNSRREHIPTSARTARDVRGAEARSDHHQEKFVDNHRRRIDDRVRDEHRVGMPGPRVVVTG